MPTIGWILEDAIERQGESISSLPFIPSPPPIFRCKWCGKSFSLSQELQRHVSLDHPLELPALYVNGEPLQRENVVRSPILEQDVELLQCSRCEVKIDGDRWQPLTLPEFRRRFAESTNTTWEVRLLHERSLDNSQVKEEYKVRFRIPDSIALTAVDEHFRCILVRDTLRHNDLLKFIAGLPTDAPAREYGGALGDYALGIILKEQIRPSLAPIRFEEFVTKMRSSLEVLRSIHRPIALAVCSSIRFNLNDFHNASTTIATDMDAAIRLFHHVTSNRVQPEPTVPILYHPLPSATRAVCPVDRHSYHLMSDSVHLSHGETLSLTALESLRQIIRSSAPISEQDLAKVHFICAEGYIRLNRTTDALPHLRTIQFNPLFRSWAQRHLEDTSSHGN